MIDLRTINNDFDYELQMLITAFYSTTSVEHQESVRIDAELKEDAFQASLYFLGEKKTQCTLSRDKTQDSKQDKRLMKIAVYKVMVEFENRELPYGILTGIRPTKISRTLFKKGHTEEEVRLILSRDYCITAEKIEIMMHISKTEEHVLSQNKPNEFSLYVGIPFCPTRCSYCSFTSYSLDKFSDEVEGYLVALIKEIQGVKELVDSSLLRSVYIGGGTPTSLNADQLGRLIKVLRESFNIPMELEFTVEAGRPDTITREKLVVMKEMGINRISINPQSMNEKTLEKIGRRHSVKDIEDCFHMAREIGFDNINMDIIVGLPGEGMEEMTTTLQGITKLNPESLTVHTMAVKRGSTLKEQTAEERLVHHNEILGMLNIACHGAQELGMVPYYMYRQKNMVGQYENIGYAKPGFENVYNIEIMEEQETILALGAGSVTKVVNGRKINRIENVKNFRQYIERIDEMIERKRVGL